MQTSAANKENPDWEAMADGMTQALIKHFWGANFEGYSDRYYFNYESDLTNMTTGNSIESDPLRPIQSAPLKLCFTTRSFL
ncbi:hypothetical protein D0T51_05210 [Parabacteroides sp. 52]|nr:hypothetical protein [Parabacteroides sp. 52]